MRRASSFDRRAPITSLARASGSSGWIEKAIAPGLDQLAAGAVIGIAGDTFHGHGLDRSFQVGRIAGDPRIGERGGQDGIAVDSPVKDRLRMELCGNEGEQIGR